MTKDKADGSFANFTIPDKVGASVCVIPGRPNHVIALWFVTGAEQRAFAIPTDKARNMANYILELLA